MPSAGYRTTARGIRPIGPVALPASSLGPGADSNAGTGDSKSHSSSATGLEPALQTDPRLPPSVENSESEPYGAVTAHVPVLNVSLVVVLSVNPVVALRAQPRFAVGSMTQTGFATRPNAA